MARRRFSEEELDAIFGADPRPLSSSRSNSTAEGVPQSKEIQSSEALATVAAPSAPQESGERRVVVNLPIDSLDPNPHQPRADFDEEKIQDMANSIRARGVLQPVLVRSSDSRRYQLIAGERRLRAARIAGLDAIPALVVSLSDQELLEVALIENLQRDDLNPIEEARAYDYLCRHFGLTHDEVAQRVGKNRTTVVNSLRLLRLPLPVKLDLQARNLTAGHARALLALDNEEQMLALHREILDKGLSVRQVEERVREWMGEETAERKPRRRPRQLPPEVEDLQNRMTEAVGVRVRLRPKSDSSGRVELDYSSLDELDRICEKLGVEIDTL